MLAALLALAASLTWGTSNFLAGRRDPHALGVARRGAQPDRRGGGVRARARRRPAASARRLGPFLLIVTGIATAAGLVMFYQALAIGTMSVVAPIIAAEVLIPVTAGILLGERPGLHAYVGMILTVGGVVLISRAPRKEKENRTEAHHGPRARP